MKNARKSKTLSRRSFRLALAFALASTVISALINKSFVGLLATTYAASAVASNEPRRQVDVTPPVTLANGQTMRLNFFNQGSRPITIDPCFLDADGQHLKMTGDISIAPGQTRSFDLSRAEAGRRTEPSVEVRGAVHADAATLQQLVV